VEAAGVQARSAKRRLEGAQLALLGTLLVLAAIAWAVTNDRMGGMASGPDMELGTLGFYVTVWVVMMAAMMFPSVAPTVIVYDRLRAGHRERGKGAGTEATALFVAGYLSVWSAAGLAAYGLIKAVAAADPAFLAWDEAGQYVTGGVIVTAAIYQVTPMKQACLVKCRSPLMFLAERWRYGRLGALELGMRHGAWCLGCCWALMAALFAVGVMSVGWMALIAAFIAGEKLLPRPVIARRTVAVILLGLGLGVAFAPDAVPGFSEPGSMDMHGEQMPMHDAPAKQMPIEKLPAGGMDDMP
jgi:predicted metal-binding membrane protein